MSPKILKDKIIDLIEVVPDEKLDTLFTFIKFLQYNDEDDVELMLQADEAELKDDFVLFDELVKELGYNPDELRNQN